MQPSIQLLKERDFGQKINATFEFMKLNFKPLMMALLYIAGPPALVAGIFMGQYMGFITSYQQVVFSGGDTSVLSQEAVEMVLPMFVLVLSMMLAGIATILVTTAYMLEYEVGNRNISPDTIWNRIKPYILPAMGYGIVSVFLIMIGLIVLVIPGIYIMIALSLMYIVLMREDVGLTENIKRCFYLVKGKWWSTFGLFFIMSFIAGIIGYIFQIPSLLVMIPAMLGKGSSSNEFLTIIASIVSTVGSVLVRSLVIIALNFQYYNLVEKKDGTGLMQAIDQLGSSNPPQIDRPAEEF